MGMINLTREIINKFFKKNKFICSNMPNSIYMLPYNRLFYIRNCLVNFWLSRCSKASKC